MKLLILANESSRAADLRGGWRDRERAILRATGAGTAETRWAKPGESLADLARQALRAGTEAIAAVGGDGTVSSIVTGFLEPLEAGKAARPTREGAVLFVFPSGRGNDWFKQLSGTRLLSPRDKWTRALELASEGRPRATDLVRARIGEGDRPAIDRNRDRPTIDRVFANVASYGLGGLVVDRVRDRTGIGRTPIGKGAGAYLAQILSALATYRPLRLRVLLDGQLVHDGPAESGFVLNGSYNAGGARWTRSANLGDGWLESLVLPPGGAFDLLPRVRAMATGEWTRVRGARIGRAREIAVEVLGDSPSYSLCEIDGESPVEAKGATRIRFEVIPGLIQVVRTA